MGGTVRWSILRKSGASPAACLLLGSLLLAGCGDKSGTDLAAPSQKIGKDLTLRYWAPDWLGRMDAEEAGGTELFKKLEEVTGVHIELELATRDAAEAQLEELRASETMPDIIEWSWLDSYPGGPAAALNDGTIASLGKLIPTHAPNLFRLLAEHPDVARGISTPDGRYYVFPDLRTDPGTRAQEGPLFRKAWLEKVGMEPPETLREWTEVFRTFKSSSFETFGSGAEYPFFMLTVAPVYGQELDLPYLIGSNAFAGAYGIAHSFYRAGGGFRYGAARPEYRQMLELLHSWFVQGYIHPALAEPTAPRNWLEVIAKCGAWIGGIDAADYLNAMKYVPVPLPRMEGEATSPFRGPTIPQAYVGRRAAAVSATSSHKEEAVRWLDIAYGAWGSRLLNFGIEGTTYEEKRGSPVLNEDVVKALGVYSGSPYGQIDVLYRFSRGVIGGPFDLSGELYRQYREAVVPGTGEGYVGWQAGSQVDPLAVLAGDPERAAELERLYDPIRRHHYQNLVSFVSGKRSLDEFDVFCRELEALGLSKAIALLEKADASWKSKPSLAR